MKRFTLALIAAVSVFSWLIVGLPPADAQQSTTTVRPDASPGTKQSPSSSPSGMHAGGGIISAAISSMLISARHGDGVQRLSVGALVSDESIITTCVAYELDQRECAELFVLLAMSSE